jgi:hypothetical protein
VAESKRPRDHKLKIDPTLFIETWTEDWLAILGSVVLSCPPLSSANRTTSGSIYSRRNDVSLLPCTHLKDPPTPMPSWARCAPQNSSVCRHEPCRLGAQRVAGRHSFAPVAPFATAAATSSPGSRRTPSRLRPGRVGQG